MQRTMNQSCSNPHVTIVHWQPIRALTRFIRDRQFSIQMSKSVRTRGSKEEAKENMLTHLNRASQEISHVNQMTDPFSVTIRNSYLEKLNIFRDSSRPRCSSSTHFTTSAAAGHVLPIFCNNAIVVLLLNSPTARRFNPCRRQASTAAKNRNNDRTWRFFSRWFTTKCGDATVFFMNTFFHHGFFHNLFYLNWSENFVFRVSKRSFVLHV